MSLCQPVIWSMVAMLRDFVVVVAVVVCTSHTASHDNHEKINSWVSFCFPYMDCLWGSAWRPFGPPELHYKVNQGCMSLSTYYLEDGRHLARLHRRRRRRAYAPTSNTASHDNYEKYTL